MKSLENLRAIARQQGLMHAIRSMAHRASERYNEYRFGIETTATITADELGYSPECREYGAVPYGAFRKLLRSFEILPDRDSFLDYGSGKGRALILAAELPFRRVIGVEYSADLNCIATQNLDNAKPKLRCRNIEIVTADAAEFVVPSDVTCAFFNNSFHGDIFRGALARLAESLQQSPRKFSLICSVPAGSMHIHQLIVEQGILYDCGEPVCIPTRMVKLYR